MMADSNKGFSSAYEDGQGESKFLAKAKKNPFVPAGIFGCVCALVYSAIKFKNKGDTKLSVYLIHTRVAAQGAIVSALTLGVGYQMYKEYVLGEKPQGLYKSRDDDD